MTNRRASEFKIRYEVIRMVFKATYRKRLIYSCNYSGISGTSPAVSGGGHDFLPSGQEIRRKSLGAPAAGREPTPDARVGERGEHSHQTGGCFQRDRAFR